MFVFPMADERRGKRGEEKKSGESKKALAEEKKKKKDYHLSPESFRPEKAQKVRASEEEKESKRRESES